MRQTAMSASMAQQMAQQIIAPGQQLAKEMFEKKKMAMLQEEKQHDRQIDYLKMALAERRANSAMQNDTVRAAASMIRATNPSTGRAAKGDPFDAIFGGPQAAAAAGSPDPAAAGNDPNLPLPADSGNVTAPGNALLPPAPGAGTTPNPAMPAAPPMAQGQVADGIYQSPDKAQPATTAPVSRIEPDQTNKSYLPAPTVPTVDDILARGAAGAPIAAVAPAATPAPAAAPAAAPATAPAAGTTPTPAPANQIPWSAPPTFTTPAPTPELNAAKQALGPFYEQVFNTVAGTLGVGDVIPESYRDLKALQARKRPELLPYMDVIANAIMQDRAAAKTRSARQEDIYRADQATSAADKKRIADIAADVKEAENILPTYFPEGSEGRADAEALLNRMRDSKQPFIASFKAGLDEIQSRYTISADIKEAESILPAYFPEGSPGRAEAEALLGRMKEAKQPFITSYRMGLEEIQERYKRGTTRPPSIPTLEGGVDVLMKRKSAMMMSGATPEEIAAIDADIKKTEDAIVAASKMEVERQMRAAQSPSMGTPQSGPAPAPIGPARPPAPSAATPDYRRYFPPK